MAELIFKKILGSIMWYHTLLIFTVAYLTNCSLYTKRDILNSSSQERHGITDTLTWKVGVPPKSFFMGMPGGEPTIEYFLNGESLGVEYSGLEKFYDFIYKKKRGILVIECVNIDTPGIDPLSLVYHLEDLYSILRHNEIELHLIFNKSPNDNIGESYYNIFKKMNY